MSSDWVSDLFVMHDYYGFHEAVDEKMDRPGWAAQLLEFRHKFLKEEMTELAEAIAAKDPAEVVDALVDLCVVAIGTLDLFEVDTQAAWDEVLRANMTKKVGVKPSRPNPLGLPDLVKPEDWVGPAPADVGVLGKAFTEKGKDGNVVQLAR